MISGRTRNTFIRRSRLIRALKQPDSRVSHPCLWGLIETFSGALCSNPQPNSEQHEGTWGGEWVGKIKKSEGKPELTATLYALHSVNTALVVLPSLRHTEASSPVTPARSPATDTLIMRRRRKGAFACRPERWRWTMSHHVGSALRPLQSCCGGCGDLSSSVGRNLTRGNPD